VQPAIERLERHRRVFAERHGTWWLTPSEVSRLTAWPRQVVHRYAAAGVIERRTYHAAGRRITRLSGRDVLSILRSRLP
jgi:hypothetical protein